MKPHENYSAKEAAKFWKQKCCTMFLLGSQENEASLRTSPEEAVSHVSNLPEPSLRSSHPSDNSNRGGVGQKESVNLRSGLIWSLASWELVFICHGRKRKKTWKQEHKFIGRRVYGFKMRDTCPTLQTFSLPNLLPITTFPRSLPLKRNRPQISPYSNWFSD